MFKMYRQKAQFASIKYNGNNVEEIKEFLSCINDYILQDLKDRKILIKYSFNIKMSSTMTLDNGDKVILLYTKPETIEMFVRKGSYILFNPKNHEISSLPEQRFNELYEEDKTVNLYD